MSGPATTILRPERVFILHRHPGASIFNSPARRLEILGRPNSKQSWCEESISPLAVVVKLWRKNSAVREREEDGSDRWRVGNRTAALVIFRSRQSRRSSGVHSRDFRRNGSRGRRSWLLFSRRWRR